MVIQSVPLQVAPRTTSTGGKIPLGRCSKTPPYGGVLIAYLALSAFRTMLPNRDIIIAVKIM